MDFTIKRLAQGHNKPFLHVDYNERIEDGLVLLSKGDAKKDLWGNTIHLHDGMELLGFDYDYTNDLDLDGKRDDLVAEGICARNNSEYFLHVKWVLRINDNGMNHVSDIVKYGW